MVRKLRYRQAIRKGKYVGSNLEGVSYKKAVRMYKALVKPETGTPTIPQARVMHTTLGTWDSKTHWDSWDCISFKYMDNTLFIHKGGEIKIVHPKANYKRIKGLTQ
ncbi:hypothetical protein P5763_07240 [Bacillus cereus]|uniref:hypothetical protein n=1 Tax=Bacillus cereus TaxID=1396 RepID=UPI0024065CC8|nr:hypothetical protein [Bacillus cereus]MDF9611866.1 hypothetical protein [Bacillus cereus]